VSKRFRTCDLNQPFLLPPSLQEWLPEDHLARFLAEVVEQLDLAAIYGSYERRDGRGQAAYHPVLMIRVLLYGYCTGRVSSRQIERCTHEDVGFRYLAANQHPDHDTVAAFRKERLEALAGLFLQTLELCREAGLVKAGGPTAGRVGDGGAAAEKDRGSQGGVSRASAGAGGTGRAGTSGKKGGGGAAERSGEEALDAGEKGGSGEPGAIQFDRSGFATDARQPDGRHPTRL
jgi:transposase